MNHVLVVNLTLPFSTSNVIVIIVTACMQKVEEGSLGLNPSSNTVRQSKWIKKITVQWAILVCAVVGSCF